MYQDSIEEVMIDVNSIQMIFLDYLWIKKVALITHEVIDGELK